MYLIFEARSEWVEGFDAASFRAEIESRWPECDDVVIERQGALEAVGLREGCPGKPLRDDVNGLVGFEVDVPQMSPGPDRDACNALGRGLNAV